MEYLLGSFPKYFILLRYGSDICPYIFNMNVNSGGENNEKNILSSIFESYMDTGHIH
jgi:hypothetical protein